MEALEPGSGLYKSKLESLSRSDIDTWKGFLSLYGRQGVWLRELLMLVYAIYSPVASFCEYRHWDDSGLRRLVNPSESNENFLVLLKDASSIRELAALEQTFVSLGVIVARSSLSGTEQGSWDSSNRLWVARFNDPYGEIDNIMVYRNLLALYSHIPDRDVHLLAERQREFFYYHAHIAIVYIFRMSRSNILVLDDAKEPFRGAFFDVTVQVLSQRYLVGDYGILEYIRGFLATTLGRWQKPDHNSQFNYRQVMLLLADLRRTASQNDVREVSSSQCLLQEQTEYLQNTIPRRNEIGHKAWGMIGYALAELMDVVETADDQETADKIVQLMREWCNTALKSRTPLEMAALCSVLVRLRAFDELNEMPQEHHLMCGYYLARTGFQQLAPQFILSGIHYCVQEMPGAPIWRYYLEFWTVAINQGHWDEAESWLLSAYTDLRQRKNTLPGGGLDMWRYSGELGEFTMSVTSLISDCYAARGHFVEAENMLTIAIGNTFLSQDDFIKTTRVALWSRLLNVQMELRNLNRASIVAFTLCCELQEPTASVSASRTTCWTIQEILVCTNELVREGILLGAYHILYLLRRPIPSPDDNHCAFVDCLPEDLIAHVHQRWEDVKSAFDPDDTIDERHHRVLDMLGPIGCLTGSLEVFHAIVDPLAEHRDYPSSTLDLFSAIDSLPYNLRSYLQLRKDVVSTKVIEGTMTMETSLSEKSVSLHRAASVVNNAPAKAVDSPSMLEVARHIVRDHPYRFPAPATRAKGIFPHISETPAATVPSLPSLTRVKREQQVARHIVRDHPDTFPAPAMSRLDPIDPRPRMSMASSLTTRAQIWSDSMPETPPQWTDRGDGFYVEFGEDEEPPLRYVDRIASHDHVTVDQYKCTETDEQVAIKSGVTYSRTTIIDEMNKEVKILRRIKHYHSIRALGSYTHQDRLGIITQPVAACDLREYLFEVKSRKTRKLVHTYGPRSDFLPRLMGCLAYGLQYIHGRNGNTPSSGAQVRHRDIKPSNILLDGRRVVFADFGISKAYTDTQTGTTGTSLKTIMYASPERAAESYRNLSCDIFSLGCVFAEIFTVIKGASAEAFLEYRITEDPEGAGYFHKTVPQVLVWLDGLANERCDVQIVRLIRGMMSSAYQDRPTAKQVWESLTICTSDSGLYFCGPCCMPMHRDDPLLRTDADTPLSETEYAISESTQDTSPLPSNLMFKQGYGAGQGPRLKWVRYLRHWDHATLDVVKSESPYPHARKRIFLTGNTTESDRAKNEAAILRKVKHRHIVALRSTYRHSNIMTLHFEPAADFDLRSFLELVELRVMRNQGLPKDFQLQKDLDFLTESFGCLSGALAKIHENGYDHGEIRPENILVHDNRIFISKFSFGLKCRGSTRGSSSDNWSRRFINTFGAMDLGSRGSQTANDTPPPTLSPGVYLYKPPEWNTEPSEVGQPAADVFSLGCVFLEIYRVLTGGRVREFEEKRADAGNSVYRDTLPKTQDLVSSFEEDEYETKDQFVGMLLCMLAQDPGERPTADLVYRTMVECKTLEGHQRCGSCPSPGQE